MPDLNFSSPTQNPLLTEKLLQRIDAAVVVTDHSCIDYSWVVKHAPLVIDIRNVTKDIKQWKKKIVKA